MKKIPWLLWMLVVAACGGKEPAREAAPADAPPAAEAEFATQARAATNELQIELKQALSVAMQEGGAVNALSACNVQAPEIASRVASETGLRVTRVSERNRNPRNVPSDAQRDALRHFEAHPSLEDTVIVDAGELTYLRPIRIGVDLCLQCHGESADLTEAVRAKLAELYPGDRATGFAMGDLRGAFVVRRVPSESE